MWCFKVNVPVLKVEDLLQFARDQRLKSDNLHWLLTSIYQRWTKHFHLLEEIEPLRHKYIVYFTVFTIYMVVHKKGLLFVFFS